MPYNLEFTIRVSVNTEEEAARLTDAVYSGYAAEIMRIGVLYGQIPVGGGGYVSQLPQQSIARQEARQREASIELKRVDTKVGSVSTSATDEPKPARPHGLAGRRRMGRG